MKTIRYVCHADLDLDKWDQCVTRAYETRIYALSSYLNKVSPGWEGLVVGDYEWVMPLTYKQKWGVSYLAQPWFCQQLGLMGPRKPEVSELMDCLRAIPARFRLVDINLHHTNPRPDPKRWVSTARHNYELDLNHSYETLYSHFSQNTRRNVKKADKQGLIVRQDLLPHDFIHLKKANEKVPISPYHYERLTGLINRLVDTGLAKIWSIHVDAGEVVAAVCLVEGSRYLTYLLASSNQLGIDTRAMFLLVHAIIHHYAEKELILDFEGSMIPGVARFYKGFGAEPITFFRIKRRGFMSHVISKVLY